MTLATATTRIVSLQETVSEYSDKQILRQTNKKRVVSMPIKQDQLATDAAQADDNPESELSMENILQDHDRASRIRVFSHTTDAPHTPSPPSSPESIVTIGSESKYRNASFDDRLVLNRSPRILQEAQMTVSRLSSRSSVNVN